MKSDPAGTQGLTFFWQRRSLSLLRLLPALAASVLVLASFFVLIRPAPPPPPVRTGNASRSILLLDPAAPANQTVLNHVRDRDALVLRPETAELSLLPQRPLLPEFQPIFEGFRMRLKSPEIKTASPGHPAIFQPFDLALPAAPPPPPPQNLPPTAASARAGARDWTLRTVRHPPLDARDLIAPPDLSSLRPHDLAKLSFRIALAPDGRVLTAAPRTSSQDDRELLPYLRELGIYAVIAALVHTSIILLGWVELDLMRLFGFEFHPGLQRYVMVQHGFALANAVGIFALLYGLVLAATSNDASMRLLGNGVWKFVQQGTYVLWWLAVAHTVYFLFVHFVDFHRQTPEPNWAQWPFVTLVLLVTGLQIAATFKTWRRTRNGGRTSPA